jgi:hypothetical protein
MQILFQNSWCKIALKGTIYVLISKDGKYNDQYFTSADKAYKAIGIDMYNHDFKHS